MKRLILFALLVCSTVSLNVHAGELRLWTGSNGKVIEAEFISFDKEKKIVKLKLKDGREQNVHVDLFSKEDQEWIRNGENGAKGDNPFGNENDEEGFESLFDGKSLGNWKGDHRVWSVRNGAIYGEVREDSEVKGTWIVYRGEEYEDFILRFEIRTSSIFNSGIQVRSWTGDDEPYKMYGNQFEYYSTSREKTTDTKSAGAFWSQTPGRSGFFAEVGQVTEIGRDHRPSIIRRLGNTDGLLEVYKKEQWNKSEVRVEGHTFTHIINGQTMSICTDNDKEMRRDKGLIGIQIGLMPKISPVKVEVKNIRIKKLPKDK